jgi:hypothetical protein
MTRLPKTLLAVAAAGLAAGGLIDFGGFNVVPAVTVVLPLGAVFFGMFMIALMLEQAMAEFAAETAEKMQRPAAAPAPEFVRRRAVSKSAPGIAP